MNQSKKKIEELKEDQSLKEIIEITRLSKHTREIAQLYEDKTRPIINSKRFVEDIKVVQFTH